MSDQHGFQVDVEALHAFGTDFQHDLDGHLSGEMSQSLHVFASKPLFGSRAVSDEVKQAARNYHARLVELFDVLDALVHNGSILARAAHMIADAYASADAVAGTDIPKFMSEAQRSLSTDAPQRDANGRPI